MIGYLLACCLLPAALATPLPRGDRMLFAPGDSVTIWDITELPNLPAGSGWFTAALLAVASATREEPKAIANRDYVLGDDYEATFVLHDPFSVTDKKYSVEVKVSDVIDGTEPYIPWWGAGYYQAMKAHGLFTSSGNVLKFQLGVDRNGNWLTPNTKLDAGFTYAAPAIYGLQILTGSKPYTYATRDKEEIKQIAKLVDSEIPIVVQTNKGLVTSPNGFSGDTSDGLHEYALLGIKPDGGIAIKGESNRKTSDGLVVDLDDLVKHLVMFISTTDLKAKLGG